MQLPQLVCVSRKTTTQLVARRAVSLRLGFRLGSGQEPPSFALSAASCARLFCRCTDSCQPPGIRSDICRILCGSCINSAPFRRAIPSPPLPLPSSSSVLGTPTVMVMAMLTPIGFDFRHVVLGFQSIPASCARRGCVGLVACRSPVGVRLAWLHALLSC